MQKLLHLSCFILMISFALAARADIISDYVETFDSADPSVSGYHPRGWDRHSYSSYYAATYNAVDLGDGNTALEVMQKYPGSAGYDDYLITPVVSGKVTLRLKLSDTGGSMKFYKITESGTGYFSKGEELVPDITPELNTSGFQEYGFSSLNPGTRLGLRGHDIIFDDFSAEVADVQYKRSLNIYSAELSVSDPEFVNTGSSWSPNYSITLGEGNALSLTFDVILENDGETTFAPGDEGYELTLKAGDTLFGTSPITSTLAPGERKQETHSFTIDASGLSGKVTFNVGENISNDYEWQQITIVPYKPEFKLQNEESTSSYSTIHNGTTLDFGSLQNTTSENVWVYNTGTAPLSFDMTLEGEGFEASTGGVTAVAAGEHIPCELKVLADGNYGPRTARLKFSIADLDDFTVTLEANMLDPNVWYENFSSKSLPANMMAESNIWQFSSGVAAVSNNYDGAKLITPKLEVDTDGSLRIKIAKNGSAYYASPSFKPYYSTDRKEWVEISGDFPISDLGTDYVDFTISGLTPGQYYIGFDCANVRIAEFYGYSIADVTHDVVVTGQSIPLSGEVNSRYKANLSVRNVGPGLQTGTFKAILTADGEAVAESMPATLPPGESASYELSFTPHAVINDKIFNIKLITCGDAEPSVIAASEDVAVSISEEVMNSSVTIGAISTACQDKAPAKTSHKYTYSDIIYPADQIPLESGAKINAISFKGKTSASGINGRIKVWIENTDASSIPNSQNTWAELDDAAVTKDFTWEFPTVDGEEILTIDLADAPFVYDGRNLRLRFKNEMEKTGTVNYYTDSKAGTAAYDYDNSATYNPKTYTTQTPVAFVSVAATPISVTGSVTDAASGDPVAGASVTLRSADVEYYGQSDPDGHYEVTLMKDLPGFEVCVTAPGYFPYSAPMGEVTDNAVSHDVALSVARDFFIKSQTIPAEMTVNNECDIVATVQNVNDEPFADGSYTVALLVDGETVDSAEGVALAANDPTLSNGQSEHTYRFEYTGHEPGNHIIGFRIDWGDGKSYAGPTVQVTINGEVAQGETRVGVPDGFSSSAPVALFYSYSTSSTLYPASGIDMPAGAEIEQISYYGYYSSMSASDAEIEVWIANTDDTEDAGPLFDTGGMVKAASKQIHFDRKGDATQSVEMMSFTLDEPFIYAGGNLRIVVRAESNGYNANFESDSSGTTWYKQGNSGFDALETASPRNDGMSVVRFVYNNSRTYKGTVLSEETSGPIEGASLVLTSDNVKYTGVTDDLGQFEIPVIRHDRTYKLDISADGFLPLMLDEVDLSEEKTYMLKVDPRAGNCVTGIGGEAEQTDAYTLHGLRTKAKGNGNEVIIINRRKTISNN